MGPLQTDLELPDTKSIRQMWTDVTVQCISADFFAYYSSY